MIPRLLFLTLLSALAAAAENAPTLLHPELELRLVDMLPCAALSVSAHTEEALIPNLLYTPAAAAEEQIAQEAAEKLLLRMGRTKCYRDEDVVVRPRSLRLRPLQHAAPVPLRRSY